MISQLDNSYIINGGPFLVLTNKYGSISKNYGWASLQIKYFNNKTIISILCNDRSENISDLLVHRFFINNKINNDLIEDIIIMLQIGYNVMFSHNYAKIEVFKQACENYFKNLDCKLSI